MEKKQFRARNLLVVLCLLAVCAGVLIFALMRMKPPVAEKAEDEKIYLVVTAAGVTYEPIPLDEPGRYTVTRGDCINIIEVTEDSICMAESSCDNQDCVMQGVVTMANRSVRVLQNMILCLPNEVVLELCTATEVAAMLPDWAEEAADGQ